MDETDVSEKKQDKPWLFKKGQSGNPAGRPKGSRTLKSRVQEYLMSLNDEEFAEYLDGINKLDIWKMGEGNPKQDADITSGGKSIVIDKDTKDKVDVVLGSFINDNTGNNKQ